MTKQNSLFHIYADLTKFAPAFLSIATKGLGKSGAGLEPLILNKAQLYIHRRLEDQLRVTGKIRALILKGRQQGCCFSPEMRVLTDKYTWVKLKDIQIGDKLFAIDEESTGKHENGHRLDRKIRITDVQAKAHLKKEAFEVKLSNGVKLIVTGDHRMLFKVRGGCQAEWRTISSSKIGDSIRAFCCAPKDRTVSFDDGWFSGMLDGEGSIGSYKTSNPRLALSQVDGLVLDKAKKYLRDNNIHYYELIDRRKSATSSKFGDKEVHCIRIDRRSDIIKILTMTQPVRLINKPIFVGKSLPNTNATFDAWVTIESIKSVGEIEVIDLQTSEKTFICEGLVSHNSTYVQARFFHKIITTVGKKAFILAHEGDATDNLFKMTRRYYDNLPPGLCPIPVKMNTTEMEFAQFNSSYRVGTAGNKKTGRSQTIHLFHGSEVAFWENTSSLATGVLQAVSGAAGTEIILESTANGLGNFFHQAWCDAIKGDSEYQAIFVPWYWQDEYTSTMPGFICNADERSLIDLYAANGLTEQHLCWRRIKMRELDKDQDRALELFKQEYPFTAEEAFLNPIANVFIKAKYVQKARANRVDSTSALVIGVDPAGDKDGADRTSIIRRRGRLAYGLETYRGRNTMEIAGILTRIIKEEKPAKVYIDSIGIGKGVVDRLREMGYEFVEGINVANSAHDKDQYLNRRAELWDLMRQWLVQDMPVQIPDSDELQSDLCSVGYKHNSNGQLVIESKQDLRKRNMPSPDAGDSLMHTFCPGQYEMSIETPSMRDPKKGFFV